MIVTKPTRGAESRARAAPIDGRPRAGSVGGVRLGVRASLRSRVAARFGANIVVLPLCALSAGVACSRSVPTSAGGARPESRGAEGESTAPGPPYGQLPAGIAAQASGDAITVETIDEVARARSVTLAEARQAVVRDALLARGAIEQGLDRSAAVGASLRSALARAELEEIAATAAGTPPSDAEIAELTALHFYDLDRPEASRVIHALARVPEHASEEQLRRARRVAETVARAVAGATDASSFRGKAESVEHAGVELVVEKLDPVAEDGRVVERDAAVAGRKYDPVFAAAAARLTRPGEQSGVIATKFGFHVLMLLERLPAHRVPLDERRTQLRDEVVSRRAKKVLEDRVRQLRRARGVEIERDSDALVAGLGVRTSVKPQ